MSARLFIQRLPDRDKVQHQAMVDLFTEAANFFSWNRGAYQRPAHEDKGSY